MKIADLIEDYDTDFQTDYDLDADLWAPDTGTERKYLLLKGDREGRLLRLQRFLKRVSAKFDISEPDDEGYCTITVDAPLNRHEQLIRDDLVDALFFEGVTPQAEARRRRP